MDKYLKGKLHEAQLWKDTYISKQIDKRDKGGTFTIEDHIRAMVYSMLSSGAPWARLKNDIDPKTRQFRSIDKIFCQYAPEALLKTDTDKLYKSVEALHYAGAYTKQQIKVLKDNIEKLQRLKKQYGSIDNLYKKFIEIDGSLKTLVFVLSAPDSPLKMQQMGEALTAEYLRNVGYNIAKPDRHIRRILGSGILGCSDKKEASAYEAFDIVAEIAREMERPIAEVDYILWSYCAEDFGEVCTKEYLNCEELCVVKSCRKKQKIGNG